MKQRCKRQKACENIRDSVINIPMPIPTSNSDEFNQSSINGENLREKRRRLDNEDGFNTSVIAVTALTAASVASSILNKKKRKTDDNSSESSTQFKSTDANLSFQSGWQKALERLRKTGFKLSSSQPNTPADGNCLFHSLLDQVRILNIQSDFKSHLDVRTACVCNFLPMLEIDLIIWIDDEDMNDWIDRMSKPGVFGDEYCMQIFANLVQRDIIYIPVHQSSAHIMKNYCVVKCAQSSSLPPMALLWFEETKFGYGHYQSIEPLEDSLVLKHYKKSRNPSCNSVLLSTNTASVSSEIPGNPPMHSTPVIPEISTGPLESSVFETDSQCSISMKASKHDNTCHICEKSFK